MRLRDQSGRVVHLAYSTSVHPAGDTEGVIAHLTRYGDRVRRRLGLDRLGLALELSRDTAAALAADRGELVRLRRALGERGLEAVMLDGVPDAPDWAQPEQYRYTLDLARILAYLLPDDVSEGGVTTLPFTRSREWPPQLVTLAVQRLGRLGRELRALEMTSGKRIRVGIVPRPGTFIATPGEAVAHLRGVSDHVGVCVDVADHDARPDLPIAALRLSGYPGLLSDALHRTGATRVALDIPPAERSIPELVAAIAAELTSTADCLRPPVPA